MWLIMNNEHEVCIRVAHVYHSGAELMFVTPVSVTNIGLSVEHEWSGSWMCCIIDALPATEVTELSDLGDLQAALRLEKEVFGSAPTMKNLIPFKVFGVMQTKDRRVVAAMRVCQWVSPAQYPLYQAKFNGELPAVAISVTSTHPDYRLRGHATALKRHLQSLYPSIITGMSRASNKEAMAHINEKLGFRVLEVTDKRTIYYWRKEPC